MSRAVLERMEIYDKRSKPRTISEEFQLVFNELEGGIHFMKKFIPEFIFSGWATIFDWIPFIALFDAVQSELFPKQFAWTYFGKLAFVDRDSWAFFITCCAGCIGSLSTVLWLVQRKSQNEVPTKSLQQCLSKSEVVQLTLQTFPETTRLIRSDTHADVILVGTSHLSTNSAIQTRSIVESVRPCAVVLELDEKRAPRLDAMPCETATEHVPYRTQLIKDLISVKTYLDPITLFARIGTRCTSYFVTPGAEFTAAARAARQIDAEIVLGDQDISKTLASIRKATPAWLALFLNCVAFHLYVLPIAVSIWRVFSGVVVMSSESIFTAVPILFVRFLIVLALWHLVTIPLQIFIKIFTEQSKRSGGMKRIGCLLGCLARMFPCLARILSKSDVKDARDVTLLQNTMKTAEKYNAGHVVISVVGLAHMDSMVDLCEKAYI